MNCRISSALSFPSTLPLRRGQIQRAGGPADSIGKPRVLRTAAGGSQSAGQAVSTLLTPENLRAVVRGIRGRRSTDWFFKPAILFPAVLGLFAGILFISPAFALPILAGAVTLPQQRRRFYDSWDNPLMRELCRSTEVVRMPRGRENLVLAYADAVARGGTIPANIQTSVEALLNGDLIWSKDHTRESKPLIRDLRRLPSV